MNMHRRPLVKMTLKTPWTIIGELSRKREYISRFHGPRVHENTSVARGYVYRGRRVSLVSAYFRSENVILKECKLRLISSEILP